MKKVIYLFIIVMLMSGCVRAEYRRNLPDGINKTDTIYIIENPKARADFLEGMKEWLSKYMYNVEILPSDSKVQDYDWVLTYTARWDWHFTAYLAEAKIIAYKNGFYTGESSYLCAPGSLEKWPSAHDKIMKIMDNLFEDEKPFSTETNTKADQVATTRSLEQANSEFLPKQDLQK